MLFSISCSSFALVLLTRHVALLEALDDTLLRQSRCFGDEACVFCSSEVDAIRSSYHLVEVIDVVWIIS